MAEDAGEAIPPNTAKTRRREREGREDERDVHHRPEEERGVARGWWVVSPPQNATRPAR